MAARPVRFLAIEQVDSKYDCWTGNRILSDGRRINLGLTAIEDATNSRHQEKLATGFRRGCDISHCQDNPKVNFVEHNTTQASLHAENRRA